MTKDMRGPEQLKQADARYNWRELSAASKPIQTRNDILMSKVASSLRFVHEPYLPNRIDHIRSWTCDGVSGELISYPSTFGPPTEAYILRPAGEKGALPGVLALHCHGNLKRWGKEKIATDERSTPPELLAYRNKGYGGRAFANELAKQGFAVLVPDTFMFGSRAFHHSDIPPYFTEAGELLSTHQRYAAKFPDLKSNNDLTGEMARDNYFEQYIAQNFEMQGLSLAGAVLHDDRNSLRVLKSLPGVRQDRLAAIGLSGGGNRVGLLKAIEKELKVGVIIGMMSTNENLFRTNNAWKHSKMLFAPTSSFIEWPDLVALGAPNPLLCLYNREDPLFTLEGQQAAHQRLIEIYSHIGSPAAYQGEFYPGPHKFDPAMQDFAFGWMRERVTQG